MHEKIELEKINQVIADYFDNITKENWVAVKELMPYFIKAGIFNADVKKGLPIRKVLRSLDAENALAKIPFVHAERKDKDTYWYFVRPGSSYVTKAINDTGVTKKQKAKIIKAGSDENYVIDLCDELLQQRASRQHKFGFLLGDYHKNGKTRTALPVDAYYAELNLVIEFIEKQHSGPVSFFDKVERRTVSGVSRPEQRKIYDERKKKSLRANNIQLIEIGNSNFDCDNENKLVRNEAQDKKVLEKLLKEFI